MAMGTCSREYKRAVMRNTAAGGNLQNSLDSLEDQKKRLVRSFEEKKLNFIEKKGTLPKLFSSLGQTGGMERSKRGQLTKQLSDSSALNESRERRLKETFSSTNDMVNINKQNHQISNTAAEQDDTLLPPAIGSSARLQYSAGRRRHSDNLSSEKPKTPLAPTLSLPSESTEWKEEQEAYGSDPELGTFKTRLRVPAPYTSLGTQLPLSPLLQRKASRPSKLQLSPLDVAAERQCVSLPASPRFQRRRAESWDQAKSQELRLNDLAEFSSEGPKLRSMSLACEKIESGKQDVGKLPPRVPASPQISPRRQRGFQPLGADQLQSSPQEGSFILPKLEARGSLSSMLDENGKERVQRRVFSLVADNATRETSPRREALELQNLSPRTERKLRNFLNSENGWLTGFSSKHEELEDIAEDDKGPQRPEAEDEECTWNSDIDDDDDETIGQKKIHSLEEIKHTRYLRMKSPVHWLPKMGNVPKHLLSSSIIVGHTKVGFESISRPQRDKDVDNLDESVSCDEIENSEEGNETDGESKLEPKKNENNNETYWDNSKLKENSTSGCN